jgi:N-acetylglucosamine-6-phosphate deacetylase
MALTVRKTLRVTPGGSPVSDDAGAALEVPPGAVLEDGQAQLGDGTLAGSTLTMDRAVKNFMDATGCSLPEAVQAASLNPARLLGIADRKGSLELGKDADIIIFDKDLNIHYTVIGGALVYSR